MPAKHRARNREMRDAGQHDREQKPDRKPAHRCGLQDAETLPEVFRLRVCDQIGHSPRTLKQSERDDERGHAERRDERAIDETAK